MPQIKSAEKRLRQSVKQTERNRALRSRLRTGRKAVLDAINSGNPAAAGEALKSYYSMLDRAAVKGVIKKNSAGRNKSRLTARINALRPAGG